MLLGHLMQRGELPLSDLSQRDNSTTSDLWSRASSPSRSLAGARRREGGQPGGRLLGRPDRLTELPILNDVKVQVDSGWERTRLPRLTGPTPKQRNIHRPCQVRWRSASPLRRPILRPLGRPVHRPALSGRGVVMRSCSMSATSPRPLSSQTHGTVSATPAYPGASGVWDGLLASLAPDIGIASSLDPQCASGFARALRSGYVVVTVRSAVGWHFPRPTSRRWHLHQRGRPRARRPARRALTDPRSASTSSGFRGCYTLGVC
jgi:hypothetical protein